MYTNLTGINHGISIQYSVYSTVSIRVTSPQILELILGLSMASVPKLLTGNDRCYHQTWANGLQHRGWIYIEMIWIFYEVGRLYRLQYLWDWFSVNLFLHLSPTPWKVPGLIPRSMVKLLLQFFSRAALFIHRNSWQVSNHGVLSMEHLTSMVITERYP